jgi:hemoglobin
MNPASGPSLYEQLGGEAAVDAAVDVFYRKVLSDDRVSSFFDDIDMDQQIAKQKAFLTMVFGGLFRKRHARRACALARKRTE